MPIILYGDDDDSILGSFGFDAVDGGGGNDTIEGAGGPDILQGGAGDDRIQANAFYYPGFTDLALVYVTMRGDAGDDVLQSRVPGSFDGGPGIDRLMMDFSLFTGLPPLVLNLGNPALTVALPYTSLVTGIELFEFKLTQGADALTLRAGAHQLDGFYGYDTLTILLDPGQDVPEAALVPDPFGGAPTFTYANGMTVTGFEVINFIAAAVTPTANGDLIYGGTGHDKLKGLGGNDTLKGNAGDDTLDGGTGQDSLIGGQGDDTYEVDSPGDAVVEQPNEGKDTIRTTLSALTLPDHVENLVMTGTGSATGTGNALGNRMSASGGVVELYGLEGNDSLTGSKNINTLDGGDGNDTLTGGTGISTLIGGAGNDRLVSKGGVTSMTGGTGDDTYVVVDGSDTVSEAVGEGLDTVRTTMSTLVLGANLENMTYLGSANFLGTGNALANTLHGAAGDDVLAGLNGNDILRGYLGDDTLQGGEGDDMLDGGFGADRLEGGTGRDVFRLFVGQVEGDVLADFDGAGLAQGDRIIFVGYGSAADGATLTHAGGVTWTVTSANGNIVESFTIFDTVPLVAKDYVFT